MREYLEAPIDLVEESADNPRQVFAADALEELKVSICQHGMLEPIVVRRSGEHFIVIAGARRLRAARLAAWETVPVLIDDKDPAQADLAAVAENLHREDLTPLDEARSYRRLLSNKTPAYTIDDLSAQFGKDRAYIYQRLTLLRLTPKIQKLLADEVLPLSYALKLATVPRERQPDALEICFRPLFRGEEHRRDQLEPMATLTTWLREHVRRDPHAQDTQMLLPDLAAQVAATEIERHRTILKVSELPTHTDRSDPEIILAKSWKPADTPAERCKHARPAIIVLGPRQDTVLDVCIAKRQCEKHWPPPATAASGAASKTSSGEGSESPDTAASRREPQEWEKREQERRRWAEELRPHALRLFAERTIQLTWSWPMLRQYLLELDITEPETSIEASELSDLVGCLSKLPAKRYPHVLAVAFALQRSWTRESFLDFAEQLGIPMTPEDLAINVSPIDPVATEAKPRSRKKSKEAA